MQPQTCDRVRELFDEVVRLPRDERQSWLRSLARDEPSTINEVRSLLESLDDAGDFLAEPQPDERPMPEPPGARVGPFVIRHHLGTGGFGDVYLAEQSEPVRRRVALKIIKPGMDSREVLARFSAERHALARLEHPGIARIIDGGATPAGRPFYVMELVDGARVTRWCDEHRLPLRQRVELFLQVCDAVQHAHQRGVIHRDLKPANVLVAEVDGRPVPKVIDFGVAKILSGEDGANVNSMLTVQPRALGTPAYMSPEQLRGETVDTRTDVYSLGLLLYELLCGRLPFEAPVPRDRDAPPMTRRLAQSDGATADFAASRSTTPAALARALCGELEWVVGRCLRGDRDERYATVNALADDLRAHLAGQPVEAAPLSRTYRARKFVARHRVAVTGAVLSVLALLVVSTAMTWLAVRARRAERLAETRLQDSEAANARAKAVNDFLTRDMIRSADPFIKAGNRDLTMRQALDNAARVLPKRFNDEPLTEAAVRESVGMAYLHLGHADQALPHGQRVLELRRAALGEGHRDTIAAVNYYAAMLRAVGRHADMAALCGPALQVARRELGDAHPQTLMLVDNYALALTDLGRYAEAEPLAKEAWEQARLKLGPGSPRTVTAMVNYGRVLQLQGRYADAAPVLRQAVTLGRPIAGDDAPQQLTTVNNLAVILDALARYDEAEALFKDVIARRRRVLGDDHPDTLTALSNYAKLLEDQARFDEAEAMAREAVDRRRRTAGPDHPSTLAALLNLGTTLRRAGRHAEAEPVAREAAEGFRRAMGADHPNTMAALVNHAIVLGELDRQAEAEPILSRVVESMRHKLGDDHPKTRGALAHHARVLIDLGRADVAEPLARQVLESARRTLGADHPDAAKAANAYAAVLQALGRREEALALRRDSVDVLRRAPGTAHPETLNAIYGCADLLGELGRDVEAEPLFAEVYRAAPAARLSPKAAAVLMTGYGPCLARLGRHQEAEPALREARRRLRGTNQTGHARMRAVLEALAAVCDQTGRPQEAQAFRDELRAVHPQRPPATHSTAAPDGPGRTPPSGVSSGGRTSGATLRCAAPTRRN